MHNFHLDEQAEDETVWKHANDGIYTAATAYKAQFLGLTLSPMDCMVWKVWAPPKVKFFAWLALQDRIWTVDRLERRGWPNCGLCPLCKREQETGAHLFFKCRYTIRLWRDIIEKIGLHHMDTSTWHLHETVKEWWDKRTDCTNPNWHAMASLTMLVSWTIWNKRNARVFRHKCMPAPVILTTILDESKLWVSSGAKRLGNLLLRE